jgi:FixJ family two-component response regulator
MELAPVIHLVDDDESFRTAVSRLLRASGYQVRTYANAGAFLISTPDKAPGCILLDLNMPGASGLELQEALTRRPDSLPIIFLSGRGDIPSTVQAMKAGAVDFLTKPVKRETLLPAIEAALERDARCRKVRQRLRTWRTRYQSLTDREREIFHHVVAGRMNKEIAAEVGAAERTVKAHRARIMEKMRVESVAELVHLADQLRVGGTIPSPEATA